MTALFACGDIAHFHTLPAGMIPHLVSRNHYCGKHSKDAVLHDTFVSLNNELAETAA